MTVTPIGPRLWLHTRVLSHLTSELSVPVFDGHPVQQPPATNPEYVVVMPQPGAALREYLTTDATELQWVVSFLIAGMTTRGVLNTLDLLALVMDGWNPHPTNPTYAAFQHHAGGADITPEGPTGYRPYSTAVSFSITAPNRRHTP